MNRIALPIVSGILCASIPCLAGGSDAEAKAVAKIEVDLGGKVVRDQKRRDSPIVAVSLSGRIPARDAALATLTVFNELRTLDVWSSKDVSDAGLAHLAGLTKLQALNLAHTQVTGAGLVHLRGMTQLESLDLSGTEVTDVGLTHLQNLKQLRELDLSGTKVSDAGLRDLRALPRLSSLRLKYTEVTDSGMRFLEDLQGLQCLYLAGTEITDDGAKKLQQKLPKCRIYRNRDLDPSLFNLSGDDGSVHPYSEVHGVPSPPAAFALLSAEGTPIRFITDRMLVAYDWPTHTMILKPGVTTKLANALGERLIPGAPFKVEVNGVVCYRGVFTIPLSSYSQSGVAINLSSIGKDRSRANTDLSIELGYPSRKEFRGKDPRNDPRIRDVLKALGKLQL